MRRTIVTVLLSVMLGGLVMFALSYITGGPQRTPSGAVCAVRPDGSVSECVAPKVTDIPDSWPCGENGKATCWRTAPPVTCQEDMPCFDGSAKDSRVTGHKG